MKYNTMLDVAFTVVHEFDDVDQLVGTDAGIDLILDSLAERLMTLRKARQECYEAFGICDTYEIT